MRLKKQLFFLVMLLYIHGIAAQNIYASPLPEEEFKRIGLQIWRNECAGSIAGLTSWNAGEEFASMGIGHFIWYPENYQGPYEEQFPKLLAFLKQHQVTLPQWLSANKHCPWKSREDFLRNIESQKLSELRTLLFSTVDLQIAFMKKRLEAALPKLLATLPLERQPEVKKQFFLVLNSNNGLYALLDYINFKGEGTSLKERYQGKGWGLLQVLEQMPVDESAQKALINFVTTAKQLLIQRVDNSPPERNEKRWLKGWFNRLDTYIQST